MSREEKEIFKKDIELALVRKWWPVVAAVCAMILFAITTTWWVAHNIATTSDIDRIMVKVDTLTNKFANIERAYMPDKNEHRAINGRIDSLGQIVSIRLVNATQHKDRYGNITYKNVN